MKTRIVIKAPILTISGYGEQARLIYKTLRNREDTELFIIPLNWGQTSWDINLKNPLIKEIHEISVKTAQYLEQKGQFDMSIQVTIPNEWEKIAPVNIGYTAGIETNKVSPQWLDKAYLMDKIIVVSEHSKEVYKQTKQKIQHPKTGQIIELEFGGSIETIPFPVKEIEDQKLNLNLSTEFNFLNISQWGVRKNLENLIVGFLGSFHDENVGLVLKTSLKNNSLIDKEYTIKQLNSLIQNYSRPNRKCKIYLLHGDMTEEEIHGLYTNKNIHAYLSISHGEGFGLPTFEAAYSGMPIITVGWSGDRDYLYIDNKPMFEKIDYTLNKIQPQAVWDGVLQQDSMWAYADEKSFYSSVKNIKENYEEAKKRALSLKKYVRKNFKETRIKEMFIKSIFNIKKDNIEDIKKISFCIPTNSKKFERTELEIKSIKKAMEKTDLEYEIILSGDVTNFDSSLTFVEDITAAHTGKLALLRNKAAERATGDVLVFVDDDFIFPESWAKRLLEYTAENEWKVLGNKILLPDGGRFWDRATFNPHRLVSYDTPSYVKSLYQTGGFWVIRNEIFENNKWNSEIEINAEKNGNINEDVELSIRLLRQGIDLDFDKENFVWHNDDSYSEYGELTLKKDIITKNFGIFAFPGQTKDFIEAIRKLHE